MLRSAPPDGQDDTFIACSPAMLQIRELIDHLAKVDIPVLCLGESGTGKEVVARLIHKMSARRNLTFMKVNCAALPPDLLESELFGYDSGAFTGANRRKPGRFELCHKGTILLDEIGEMTPPLQAKLLHVLQDGEFTHLGGCAKIKVDVRVIAATNVDIRQAIDNKTFREDLYYRLSTIVLHLPPLRERLEDILPLLERAMNSFSIQTGLELLPLSHNLKQACLRYHWPGNVRELESFAKRYLILRDEPLLLRELIPPNTQSAARSAIRLREAEPDDLKLLVRGLKKDAEVEAIQRALEETHWNRKEAARLLRISYKALLYKIRQYELEHRSIPTRPADPTKVITLRRAAGL